MRPVIGAALATAILAGCTATDETFQLEELTLADDRGWFDNQSGPGVPGVSVDAKQRFVWSPRVTVREFDVDRNGIETYRANERAIVCAEPSPDALSALAAATAATVSAQEGDAAAAAAFSRSVSESVQQIGERTQVIQLMRDTLYRACEGYANGALDAFSYSLILGQIDIFMVQMLGIDSLGGSDPAKRGAALQMQAAEATFSAAEAEVRRARVEFNRADNALQLAGGEGVEGFDDLKQGKRSAEASLRQANSELATAKLALDSAAVSYEVASQGGGGGGRGSSEAIRRIVEDATGANNLNTGSRAASAACLMWLARHPQVRLTADAGGAPRVVMPGGEPPPAIAAVCAAKLLQQPHHGKQEWIDK